MRRDDTVTMLCDFTRYLGRTEDYDHDVPLVKRAEGFVKEYGPGRCPSCGQTAQFTEERVDEEFRYGAGDKAVKLTASVVAITCTKCRTSWTDDRGEDAKSEAVTHYLQERVKELEVEKQESAQRVIRMLKTMDSIERQWRQMLLEVRT